MVRTQSMRGCYSPPGKVGPLGPESVIRFAKQLAFIRQSSTARLLTRPISPRRGEVSDWAMANCCGQPLARNNRQMAEYRFFPRFS